MSPQLGTYTFMPWLRQGLANRITAVDHDPAVTTRASIDVVLRVTAQPVGGGADQTFDRPRNVSLFGPGDIVGIRSKAIVKVEPGNWITNFEANYLPYVEFYDEDFPWRYTPATRDGVTRSRLRPWIVLVVLKEDEFEPGTAAGDRPLPFVVVKDPAVFPAADTLWAWAHVHVNRGLIADPSDTLVGPNENAPALAAFEQTLNENPDLAYSRILSPRHLEPETAYHAFVMPVFESGRLAGLGQDPAGAPHATASAWAGGGPDPTFFPYYHRWRFRTSTIGDFEYLVRLLEAKPIDSRVGRRDMDVQDPGANLPGISRPELGGVLKLGGALQIPRGALSPSARVEADTYDNWDTPYPQPFQARLAEFVNLPDEYAQTSVAAAHAGTQLTGVETGPNPDPVITAPLYGRWHALTRRLLRERDGAPVAVGRNWVHQLNLDPRWRATAGFGTRVVQQNQETYMEAAWQQIGNVLEANRQMNWGQLARRVSAALYAKHLEPMAAVRPQAFLNLTAPVDARFVVDRVARPTQRNQDVTRYDLTTRRFVQQASLVPRTILSAPMRRVLRPRGPLTKDLPLAGERPADGLVRRLNSGDLAATPPSAVSPDLPLVETLADALEPPGVPRLVLGWLDRASWLKYLPLVLLVILLLVLALRLVPGLAPGAIAGWSAVAAMLVGVVLWLTRRLGQAHRRHRAADGLRGDRHDPKAVDAFPESPDFVLTPPTVFYTPTVGAGDSPEATRFKTALKDMLTLTDAGRKAAAQPPKVSLDLGRLTGVTLAALDPEVTVSARLRGRVAIPTRIADRLTENFVQAMAYPEIDVPMYRPLVDISDDLFLPNIRYVAQNSISLLETNQNFIEAYMVGLNHEFARELLWRQFVTDQRGSYFRQFWDVSSYRDREGLSPEALREKLRDIPPLHRWSRWSALGDHDHREQGGANEEELVLLIRGELLKKYPTAVIYAHRAAWRRKADGAIDRTQPRDLAPLSAAEESDPPPEKVRTPLYEAKVDPDIYFFGFDLTETDARGESAERPDDPGWFFVIKERPGEPRFGLDVDQDGAAGGPKHLWNDISWADVGGGAFLRPTPAPGVQLVAPPGTATAPQKAQHDEDVQIVWNDQVSAAEMAYILYQVPVLVAVHATEMLGR